MNISPLEETTADLGPTDGGDDAGVEVQPDPTISSEDQQLEASDGTSPRLLRPSQSSKRSKSERPDIIDKIDPALPQTSDDSLNEGDHTASLDVDDSELTDEQPATDDSDDDASDVPTVPPLDNVDSADVEHDVDPTPITDQTVDADLVEDGADGDTDEPRSFYDPEDDIDLAADQALVETEEDEDAPSQAALDDLDDDISLTAEQILAEIEPDGHAHQQEMLDEPDDSLDLIANQEMPDTEAPTDRLTVAETEAADALPTAALVEDERQDEGGGIHVLADTPVGDLELGRMSEAMQAGKDRVDVPLDWPALLASGFVDPRHAEKPLPANIDSIAKALIRQALSDQSSWRDRVILVSSARETRSKSMAALNFAFALSTADHHDVVLLDANMDGSGVAAHLDATQGPGLTTALCDSTLDIETIAKKTSHDRLTLVSSGDYEDDILDRFASRRMLEILRFLTKSPDTLLILDAPPILSSQESTVLSVIAGQVVLVVEAGSTNRQSINSALKRIGDRHNLSLVLSHHSGVERDEPALVETPASRRLSLPKPKRPPIRRLWKQAAASFVIVGFIGLGVFIGTVSMMLQQSSEERSEVGMSNIDVPLPGRETPAPNSAARP